jgi:hypothetical protein
MLLWGADYLAQAPVAVEEVFQEAVVAAVEAGQVYQEEVVAVLLVVLEKITW